MWSSWGIRTYRGNTWRLRRPSSRKSAAGPMLTGGGPGRHLRGPGDGRRVCVCHAVLLRAEPARHFLVGNHDYIYDDATSAKGGRIRAGPASRAEKLQRFKTTFGLDEVYASRRVGNYLLIFMSTDHLLSRYLAHVSDRQLEWLRAELGSIAPHRR